MAGHIRTLHKCPSCGKPYPKELVCCNTRPTRYFIDLWWQGRLKIYTDPQGYPLDSYARTEQLLSTIRHQIGAGKFDPREYVRKEIKGLLFENYIQTWLERRDLELERGHISKAYMREVRRYIRLYFVPFFERKSIRDIREGDLEDFKNSLPTNLANKTIRNILGVLHKIFADAFHKRRDIAYLPKFPEVPKDDPLTQWLPPRDQERVLRRIKEPYKSFFICLMELGCRPGELRALKWGLVDRERRLITIAAGFDLETWKPYTKTRQNRTIPYNQKVQDCLDRQPRSLTGFVFVNSKGKYLSHRRLDTVWFQAARACGIEVNLYQATRHSFATQKIAAGFSRDKVGQMMGHRTAAMTQKYEKVVAESLRDLVADCPSGTVRKLSVNKNGQNKP
jgi:integrase